jgi:hypothetical protein
MAEEHAADDLDTTDALETPAAEGTTEALDDLEELDDDRGDADRAAPTENKWAARRSLSEMLEDDDAEQAKQGKPAKQATPAKSATRPTVTPTAAGEGDDEALDEDDEDLDDAEQAKQGNKTTPDQGKKDGEGAAKETSKPRYTVKGPDGKAFAFELTPGTAIQFKADGKDVEATSIDALVQLAQKGAAYDRKTTEQGHQIAQLRTRETELQTHLKTVRTTAEQTLLAALFDDEKAEALRKALAPYQDPEYRKGIEAQEQLAQREQADQQTETQQLEAQRTEFWQGVGADIRAELTSGKFEHLTDADAMDVATRFHQGYSQAYTAKFEALKAAGTPEAQAHAQANTHAFAHFTEKNLRRVMRGLNAELAEERTASGKKKPAGQGRDPNAKPADERSARAAADAHNKTTTDKLEQRRRAPRLQGGGAAPGNAGRVPAPTKPRTFAERMDTAFSLLRTGDED